MNHPALRTDPSPLREWQRLPDSRKIAGVCSGLAAQLELPVTAVRAAFVLGAVLPSFTGLAVGLYLVLWFLMPVPGGTSGLDRVVEAVSRLSGDDVLAGPEREDPELR